MNNITAKYIRISWPNNISNVLVLVLCNSNIGHIFLKQSYNKVTVVKNHSSQVHTFHTKYCCKLCHFKINPLICPGQYSHFPIYTCHSLIFFCMLKPLICLVQFSHFPINIFHSLIFIFQINLWPHCSCLNLMTCCDWHQLCNSAAVIGYSYVILQRWLATAMYHSSCDWL